MFYSGSDFILPQRLNRKEAFQLVFAQILINTDINGHIIAVPFCDSGVGKRSEITRSTFLF